MGGLACIACRKRKVLCDRNQPVCTRCLDLGKKCEYPARIAKKVVHIHKSRVAEFEAKLGHMESQLRQKKVQGEAPIGREKEEAREKRAEWKDIHFPWFVNYAHVRNVSVAKSNLSRGQDALPSAQLQEHLYHIYFQQFHPSAPMIHKSSFFRARAEDPSRVPPLALRYAMWTIAASETAQYQHMADYFYNLSRKHAEDLEVLGVANSVTVSCAQCWYLLATYESSRARFIRAWMSVGRCVGLVQVMGLHRLDSPYDEKHIFLPGSQTEKEELRRTFWVSYFADRWASALSGNPLIIRDEDICTNLPLSEEAFEYEVEEVGISPRQKHFVENITCLSPFAGSIFTMTILGNCVRHVQAQENTLLANTDRDFWETHRQIENSISQVFLHLPTHLRLSPEMADINLVFLHLNLHVTVILLHRMAIRRITKQRVDLSVRQRYFQRCLVSSVEIKNIIYSIKDMGMLSVYVKTSFYIYVAAEVFIDDIRSSHSSFSSPVDLGLLLIALKGIGRSQTIMNYFARRLESDISKTGVGYYIPADLREIAGISITNHTMSIGGSSKATSYCSSVDEVVSEEEFFA